MNSEGSLNESHRGCHDIDDQQRDEACTGLGAMFGACANVLLVKIVDYHRTRGQTPVPGRTNRYLQHENLVEEIEIRYACSATKKN